MEIGQSRGLPSGCLYDRTLPRQHRGRGLPWLRQRLGSAYIAGVDLLGAEAFTYLAHQGLEIHRSRCNHVTCAPGVAGLDIRPGDRAVKVMGDECCPRGEPLVL